MAVSIEGRGCGCGSLDSRGFWGCGTTLGLSFDENLGLETYSDAGDVVSPRWGVIC